MKKIIIPFLLIFHFFSCSSNPKIKDSAEKHDTIPAPQPVKKIKEYKGVYHPGQFKNAQDSQLYTFNEADQKKLDSLYSQLLPAPYPNQTVFLDFKGAADYYPANTGFRISLTELISMELKNGFNSSIPYNYWCMGTEPFWQLQVSEKENLIDFYDPMASKFYHFPFFKAETIGNNTIYTAEDKSAGSKIKITITKENCSDGMSEHIYNYKSEVMLNGKPFKGCAAKFGEMKQLTN